MILLRLACGLVCLVWCVGMYFYYKHADQAVVQVPVPSAAAIDSLVTWEGSCAVRGETAGGRLGKLAVCLVFSSVCAFLLYVHVMYNRLNIPLFSLNLCCYGLHSPCIENYSYSSILLRLQVCVCTYCYPILNVKRTYRPYLLTVHQEIRDD